VSERSLAMSAIQQWRQIVLEEHCQWKIRFGELETAYKKELNEWKEKREQALLMVSYFSSR